MTNSQRDIDYQKKCSKMLLESCSIYSEINSLYQKLGLNISSSPQLVTDIVKQLESQQVLAKSIDDSIKNTLDKDPSLIGNNEDLFRKREFLLQDNLARNKATALKAISFKSHLQHEVGSIHTNRHAINGYRIPEGKRNLINNKF